jgi:hypothetical protein
MTLDESRGAGQPLVHFLSEYATPLVPVEEEFKKFVGFVHLEDQMTRELQLGEVLIAAKNHTWCCPS